MEKNERILILEGAASSAYLILTQGALFTAVAVFFGLDAWWLGVAAAFPMVFQMVQVLAPPLVARSPDRPGLLNLFNALRAVWLVPVAAALLGYRSAALFIVAFGLSQAANAFAGNVWQIMCRDLVGPERRGGFFGRRNAVLAVVTVLAVPLYSWIMDAVAEPWNVALIVSLGMAGTAAAIAVTTGIKDRRPQPADAAGDETAGGTAPGRPLRQALASIMAPAADPGFRRLAAAFFSWNLAVQVAAPFFSYHQVKNLGLSWTLLGFTVTAANLVVMVCYRLWGRVADRTGHKSVLMVGLSVATMLPALWVFMGEPLWPVLLGVDVILSGVGWAAVNLTMLTLPMETSERADSRYFALLNALGGLGGLLGSLAGGAAASALQGLRFSFLGVDMHGLQLLFGADSLLRLAAVLMFARVRARRYVRPVTLVMNLLAVLARRAPLRAVEMDDEGGS